MSFSHHQKYLAIVLGAKSFNMNKYEFLEIVKPHTMTTNIRIFSLFDSLEHIRINNIDGDFVECGVWQGGNILGIISYLSHHNILRNVWLYDTFNGIINPSIHDVDFANNSAYNWIGKCDAKLELVKNIVYKPKYPKELIRFVEGDICETLLDNNNVPSKIALLRLDTDWYESTKKELEVLHPKVSKGGITIIDDYGHWKGCKKAVDEYFINPFMKEEIDYTCIRILN
jgi:hypothetical protein